jgi:hypothetical protein
MEIVRREYFLRIIHPRFQKLVLPSQSEIDYYSHILSTVCSKQQKITAPMTFTSPLYPESYPNDVRCRILIDADDASALSLTFNEFVVADEYDRLTIADGWSKYSPVLGVFTHKSVVDSGTCGCCSL